MPLCIMFPDVELISCFFFCFFLWVMRGIISSVNTIFFYRYGISFVVMVKVAVEIVVLPERSILHVVIGMF